MIRIPVANPVLTDEDADAVADAVRSGRVSSGPRVRAFETALEEYLGVEHAVAVSSGTAALHVALAALNVGPGDEVILPSLTFVSTASVVLYQGATPVLCECDPVTYNVTVDELRRKITDRTKAIIPVDMNGLTIDYGPIMELARDAGVGVIADSAEALGSEYNGDRVGTQADIHCFSFFPNKTITTGEGGLLATRDKRVAERARTLMNQGQSGRYHHVELGYNYRMTEMQAALGLSQMNRIDALLNAKERMAKRYDGLLAGIADVELPHRPGYATAQSWYMYSVRVPDLRVRDAVVRDLDSAGIETRLGFPPIHGQPFIVDRYGERGSEFPVTQSAWERKIDLPSWPEMPEDTQAEVANAVERSVRNAVAEGSEVMG